MTAREIASGAMERRAMQKERELCGLLSILQRHQPLRTVVEIGGMFGGTLWAWDQIMTEPEWMVVVDNFTLEGRLEHMPAYATHINADSHDPVTADAVRAALHSDLIDFLFIDGDHSLPGVTADWNLYSPLVRKGGIVALHDTAMPHSNVEAHNILPLWNELQERYETLQIFDSQREAHWGGIGVIFV